jgi:hypothetical protein
MFRKNELKQLCILLAVVGLVSACEMKNNLDDMHDATNEMSDTTKQMKTRTDGLDNKTAELYDALRQGNASLLRKEFLDAMKASNEMPKKLALGVKYFWAYEFQLWSMDGLDDDARREELAASAAREFIREIHELVPQDDTFISPTSSDNSEKDFLALATTMHEVNDKQKNRVDKLSMQRFSMLFLFERALSEKRLMSEGKMTMNEIHPSSYDLLAFEQKMVQILQARHNFILTMWLAKASNIDKGLWNKINLGLFGSRWDFNMAKFSDVEISEMNKWLKAVSDTRQLLTLNGYEVEVDSTILKVLRNSRINTSKSAVSTSRESMETAILENLKTFMK